MTLKNDACFCSKINGEKSLRSLLDVGFWLFWGEVLLSLLFLRIADKGAGCVLANDLHILIFMCYSFNDRVLLKATVLFELTSSIGFIV